MSDFEEGTRLQRPFRKLVKRSQTWLSPKGRGLYRALGLLMLAAATWLFGAIAEDVTTNDPLTLIDVQFSRSLHAHSTAALTMVMRVITNLHSPLGVTIMTLVVGTHWWLRRLRYWVLTLMLAVFGGMLLNFLLKHIFVRPRPHFNNPILTLTTYGFPSGHTMAATVFYGTLCAFIVTRVRRWYWRALAILVALFLVALVGFSRIYLGAHYLSDVLAAMAEGWAWLAFCLIATGTIRRWQDQRN